MLLSLNSIKKPLQHDSSCTKAKKSWIKNLSVLLHTHLIDIQRSCRQLASGCSGAFSRFNDGLPAGYPQFPTQQA